MTPASHLRWFEENTDFFASIRTDDLTLPVSSCPGWIVLDLLNHLSFGLGACYPVAASTPPETPPESIFAKLDREHWVIEGNDAVTSFSAHMRTCLSALRAIDPDRTCWTYVGPGTASFWFLRAAAETALHRHDAELTLGITPAQISNERLTDGLNEALNFALPFAATKIGSPKGSLTISCPDIDLERSIGSGDGHTEISAPGQAMLLALWGRERDHVHVSGSQELADGWLSLVENAFAGR